LAPTPVPDGHVVQEGEPGTEE
jgi:hypothetical protein